MTDQLQDWLDAFTFLDIVLFLTALGGLVAGVRWIAPAVRKVNSGLDMLHAILERWNGVPEQKDAAGYIIRKAEPGVLARLEKIEHEVTPNHGGSAHDAVMRSMAELRELVVDLASEFGTFKRDYARDLHYNHPTYRPDQNAD